MELNREDLLKTATLLRPALAVQSYIPAYQHIRFGEGVAVAYNDIMGVSLTCDAGKAIKACVPGEPLLRVLSSFNTKTVDLLMKGDTLHIKSGRSTVKLPTLPYEDFTARNEMPKDCSAHVLHEPITDGIRQCLQFSGSGSAAHPSTLGVTIQSEDGCVVLYATDDATITASHTGVEAEVPRTLLPGFFCEQLLSMRKSLRGAAQLLITPKALFVDFEAGVVFTKTQPAAEPLDFPRVMERCVDRQFLEEDAGPIPADLEAALQRAIMVVQSSRRPRTRVMFNGSNMELLSEGDVGHSEDALPYEGRPALDQFSVDPHILARALKVCDAMAVGKEALVLMTEDAQFLHLISYLSV